MRKGVNQVLGHGKEEAKKEKTKEPRKEDIKPSSPQKPNDYHIV